MRQWQLASGILVACLIGAGELNAQANRYGCSLDLPQIIEAGLDRAVARACTRRDQCWRVQGTCGGWNPGFAHKAQCDLAFYGELNSVCALTGAAMRISGEPADEVTEFLEDCAAAATAVYGGVSAALRTYAGNQCRAYCNSRMCDWLDWPLPKSCCEQDPRCCDDDCPPEPPDRPIVNGGGGG